MKPSKGVMKVCRRQQLKAEKGFFSSPFFLLALLFLLLELIGPKTPAF